MRYSIIVPVYNTAAYLPACVESILCQTVDNFELLLIDDGSTDNSGDICDAYAEKDSRIRVVHQSNAGSSAARNRGICEARGEYILFMDSDDFYADTEVLEKLRPFNQDVICFNYVYADKEGELWPSPVLQVKPIDMNEKRNDEQFYELVKKNIYTSSACLKCVRASIIHKDQLYFDTELLWAEDIPWNAKLSIFASGFAFAPDALYAYRKREGSKTASISQKSIDNMISILTALVDVQLTKQTELYKNAYYSYVAFQFCTLLINVRLAEKDHLLSNLKRCKQFRWLLQYDAIKSVKFVRIVLNILGLRITSFLMYRMFLFKKA